MNDKRDRGGPSVGLLLLIPAAVLAVHAAKRRHRMLWDDAADAGSPAPYSRHGRGLHAAGGWHAADRGEFRLPPRIEATLAAWHTRAHQADAPTEAPTA